MKKRLLSAISALLLVMCMTPAGVLAAETGDGVIDTDVELAEALVAGGEVILGGDITLTHEVIIDADTTLDLNGHTITLEDNDLEEGWSFGRICVKSGHMIIKDSKGGGAVKTDQYGNIALEDNLESFTIESGAIGCLSVYEGMVNINGGTIDELLVWGNENSNISVVLKDEATVSEWDVNGIATYNFDPSECLYAGYMANNNGDGTYTTGYKAVEETGETYTIYFYNWNEKSDFYYLDNRSDENPGSAQNLNVIICNVKGNADDDVTIPMTKLDETGKYWSAEIDMAYMNAKMFIDAGDFASYVLVLPDEDGVMFSVDNDWTIYGMDDTISDISDSLAEFNKDTVTAADKAAIEAVIKEVDEQLKEKYLSDAQKAELEEIKKTAEELIAVIEEAEKEQETTGEATPDTGDGVSLSIWMVVMLVAVSAFVGIVTKMNKSESES